VINTTQQPEVLSLSLHINLQQNLFSSLLHLHSKKTKMTFGLSKAQRLAPFSFTFFVRFLPANLKCAILLRMQTWYALFLQWMIVCHMQKEMPAILDLRFCKEQKLLKHSIIESSRSKGSSGFLFLL